MNIVEEHGVGALLSGIIPSVLGSFVYSSVRYLVWDTLKSYALKLHELASQKLSNRHTQRIEAYHTRRPPRVKTFTSIILVSSVIGYLLCKPFEVVRIMLQIDALSGSKSFNSSALKTISHIYNTHGLMGFWMGFAPGATYIAAMSTFGFLAAIIPEMYDIQS